MDPRAARASWLSTMFAMLAAVLLYGGLAMVLATAGARPAGELAERIRMPLLVAGALCAVAGAAWMLVRTGSGDDPPPRRFLTESLVAAALAEVPAVLGLVHVLLGGPLGDFLIFAAISATVIVVLIIPAGIRYWAGQIHGGES